MLDDLDESSPDDDYNFKDLRSNSTGTRSSVPSACVQLEWILSILQSAIAPTFFSYWMS